VALVALLVIALVCLAVGLVLPSVAWLIASLIATAGAGFLLVKARSTILAPHTAGPGTDAPHAVQDADATSVLPRVDPTGGVDGSPAMDAPVDAPGQTGETGDAAVDSDQVRSEITEAAYAAGPDDVWVIDGRPRYHVRTCVIIQGQDAEPIPFSQAVEDGFMPCSLCEPQLARAVASDS
jgi:hypothetical protein